MLKRRQFLGAGAEALRLRCWLFRSRVGPKRAQSGYATLPSPGFRRTKMGDVEIISVLDGIARRPLGEEFVKNARSRSQSPADLPRPAHRLHRRAVHPVRGDCWRTQGADRHRPG